VGIALFLLLTITLGFFVARGGQPIMATLRPLMLPEAGGFLGWITAMVVLSGLVAASQESDEGIWRFLRLIPLRPGYMLLSKAGASLMATLAGILALSLGLFLAPILMPTFSWEPIWKEWTRALYLLLPLGEDGLLRGTKDWLLVPGVIPLALGGCLGLTLAVACWCRGLVASGMVLAGMFLGVALTVEFVLETFSPRNTITINRLGIYNALLWCSAPGWWWAAKRALEGGTEPQTGRTPGSGLLERWSFWVPARTRSGGRSSRILRDPGTAEVLRPSGILVLAFAVGIGGMKLLPSWGGMDLVWAATSAAPFVAGILGCLAWSRADLEPQHHIQGFLPVSQGFWMRQRAKGVVLPLATLMLIVALLYLIYQAPWNKDDSAYLLLILCLLILPIILIGWLHGVLWRMLSVALTSSMALTLMMVVGILFTLISLSGLSGFPNYASSIPSPGARPSIFLVIPSTQLAEMLWAQTVLVSGPLGLLLGLWLRSDLSEFDPPRRRRLLLVILPVFLIGTNMCLQLNPVLLYWAVQGWRGFAP